MDTGFIDVASLSFTDDNGRKLENIVYLHLRRQYKEIFFFKDKGECDFVTFDNGRIKQLIQVCYEINDENFNREINGLTEAMRFFDKKKGYILTLDQKDSFKKDGLAIEMLPVFTFFKENSRPES
jgi:predicted AAA+ superfamily ATPase